MYIYVRLSGVIANRIKMFINIKDIFVGITRLQNLN